MITREEMKEEALERIKEITKELDLNPHIYDYFKNDKLYYSYELYITGSIDVITYNEQYPKLVEDFEKKYNCMVYHAVECKDEEIGDSLALLYVSSNKEEWEAERLYMGKYIEVYVYNLSCPSWSEFGTIQVGQSGGALIRIE